MLLGVQHFVLDALAGEHGGQLLRLLHRDGAHQHGLAGIIALGYVVCHGFEFGVFGAVDHIGAVVSHDIFVGGDGHHAQSVSAVQLGGFGLGGACHAGELVVEAEVVLEGDGGERLVLFVDLDAFFGFHGLVETVRPAAPFQNAAGEFVYDLDFAFEHHIVAVAQIQLFGSQGGVELVHIVDL